MVSVLHQRRKKTVGVQYGRKLFFIFYCCECRLSTNEIRLSYDKIHLSTNEIRLSYDEIRLSYDEIRLSYDLDPILVVESRVNIGAVACQRRFVCCGVRALVIELSRRDSCVSIGRAKGKGGEGRGGLTACGLDLYTVHAILSSIETNTPY
ncbi:unnamed protein product [Choristocarpus tenellus]